jgi:hypothetical protein
VRRSAEVPERVSDEMELNRKAYWKERYGRPDLLIEDLNAFEDKFSTKTVAGSSRADVLVGRYIGNGAHWLRYPPQR